jgi:cobalt-zinc-cadmium efflux system membrane fusion protein
MLKNGIAVIFITALFTGCNSGPSEIEGAEVHEEDRAQFTLFTADTEFFIEHPHLVKGEEAEFLIHVTHLDTYQPCLTGTLTLQVGGLTVRSSEPDRPGIFILSLIPEEEGEFDVKYTLQSGGVTSVVSHFAEIHHSLDEVEEAHSGELTEEARLGEVFFSKEMSWENNMVVAQVLPQPFSPVLRASGEIMAVPGEKKNLAANSRGMVVFADRNLVQGSRVEKGQHLFTIIASAVGSDNLELLYQEYLNRLNKSRSEFQRHEILFEGHVIPERQYMESRTTYISDSIRFYNLAGKAGKDGMEVHAPAAGFIHHLNVSEGQYVETGQLLVTISSDRKLLLRADIPQQHYSELKQIVTANFRPAFTERIYSVDELNGRLLARGSSVAENDHYIPVYFEVENDGSLLEGAFAEFYLMGVRKENQLLVPESAIFEEQGNHFIYLQVGGENYIKKAITLGQSDGMKAEVVSGIHPGDRIVIQGTMLVKSASMVFAESGHGHSH